MVAKQMDVLTEELSYTLDLPWQVVVMRLCGSVLLCGLIGLEREARERPAGLRTHMLVGLAASLFCLVTLGLVGKSFGSDVRMDPVRLVEAVTAGVAFLAAGMIVFSKGEVRGLTTGASMWLAASIGLGVGLGFWLMAGVATLLGLAIIRVLAHAEGKLDRED